MDISGGTRYSARYITWDKIHRGWASRSLRNDWLLLASVIIIVGAELAVSFPA